jgi:hypothetical protein
MEIIKQYIEQQASPACAGAPFNTSQAQALWLEH